MIRKCNFWDHTPPVPGASYRQAQLLYFDHISGNVLQIDRGTVWYARDVKYFADVILFATFNQLMTYINMYYI